VEFVVDGGDVRIIKAVSGRRPSRGAAAVHKLRGAGGRIHMTTDQIMALTRSE
jgi:hypothetical protein